MVLIFGVGAAAVAALLLHKKVSSQGVKVAEARLAEVRRSTGVVWTLSDTVIRVADALSAVVRLIGGERFARPSAFGPSTGPAPMRPLHSHTGHVSGTSVPVQNLE